MRRITISTTLLLLLAGGCAAEVPTGDPLGTDSFRSEGAVTAVDVSVWSRTITDTEMDCLHDEHGVEHVVVGTQNERIARQHFEMAVERGMSVDAYVYLYWDSDIEAQVQRAADMVGDAPIGIFWLDVEQDPGREAGPRTTAFLEDRIQESVEACRALGYECGIYTSVGFWGTWMGGSEAFSDLPLWDANYGTGWGDPTLESYESYAYGGWTEAFGKQYAGDLYRCDVELDLNTMRVVRGPARERPVAEAPPEGPPATPTGLAPADFVQVRTEGVRVMAHHSPGATRYAFEIEYHDGRDAYRPYFTFPSSTNAKLFFPGFDDRAYRFRARAENGYGESGWSEWSYFLVGDAVVPAEPLPEDPPEDPPPAEDPPMEDPPEDPPPAEDPPAEDPPEDPPPPSDPGAPATPTGLSPSGGATVTTPSATLTCDAAEGAVTYQFEIQLESGGSFAPYYTYSGTVPSRTFYPAVDGTYRFRVIAVGSDGASATSAWATFQYGG